jgi:hypothetical protein
MSVKSLGAASDLPPGRCLRFSDSLGTTKGLQHRSHLLNHTCVPGYIRIYRNEAVDAASRNNGFTFSFKSGF